MHVTFSIEPFVLAAEEAKACSCQGRAQSLLYHLQAGDPEAALNLLEEMETATPGMLQHCRLIFPDMEFGDFRTATPRLQKPSSSGRHLQRLLPTWNAAWSFHAV